MGVPGVHLSFLSLRVSNYSGQISLRQERNWEGCAPLSRLGGLGERRKLPQRGRPSRKLFWGVSCAILCDFTHLLVQLTAAWKWELPIHPFIGYWFNFYGLSDTTIWNFGVSSQSGHPPHPQCQSFAPKINAIKSRSYLKSRQYLTFLGCDFWGGVPQSSDPDFVNDGRHRTCQNLVSVDRQTEGLGDLALKAFYNGQLLASAQHVGLQLAVDDNN